MIIIIEERKLPAGTTAQDLQTRFEAMRATGDYISVRIEERETGPVQVVIRPSFSDIIKLHLAGTSPAKFFAEKDIDQLLADFDNMQNLGILSAKYESNGDPAAIGHDAAGGFSYGAYQLASKRGSVGSFIEYLTHVKPDYAETLNSAGGETASVAGTSTFKQAWTDLAENTDFLTYQHGFIKTRYYDPVTAKFSGIGLDLSSKSFALQNVAWSTAVQHGPGGAVIVFKNSAVSAGISLSDAADEAIIEAVYSERSKVTKYFKSVPSLHPSLLQRFNDEKNDALAML